MKYKLNDCSRESAYMQLYRQIKEDITKGFYPYGSRLPSKRLLAEETGASVITVQHAYALLCDEGYIEARERSGYFVIYRETDFISSYDSSHGAALLQSSVHQSDTSIAYTTLAKTVRRVLSECGEKLLVKSPGHGCTELRNAIASYLARTQGIYVTPEQIVVGSGAEHLYSLVAMLFFGRKFAIESPSYEKIHRVYEASGINFDCLSMSNDGVSTVELRATDAEILHVTPYNSFPSSISATASKKAEYIKWADERQGYIIEDNYASELTVSTKNESTLYSLSDGDRVIYLNTFSKTIAPSLRIGYMVLPSSLLPYFEEKLGFMSCTVPVLEQYVITELLVGGEFERHINRVRRAKRKLI